MTKITSDHLARGAYVYIRQSTADQLLRNHESRRRQYGLAVRKVAPQVGAIHLDGRDPLRFPVLSSSREVLILRKLRFVPDSPLEGAGFEPSVPRPDTAVLDAANAP